jgi:transmembrane sensor
MDNQRFEELLIGELTGDLTPAERQELTAFLQADAAHRKEYEIFKDFWAQKDIAYTDNQSVLDKIKERIGIQEENSVPVRRLYGPGRRSYWRSAAAVLLFVLGGYGVYHHFYAGRAASHDPLDWQEKYTARKTRSKMILADGSSVTLNADSRLKYPASFDGPVREVYLTGEAFFDIQKDPEHPFIIHTDKMNIRVLGTAFNVKSYPGDASMETTLLQGSVEVTFPDRPADKIILKPTDKLVIHNFVRVADSAEAAGPATPTKKTGGNPDAKYTLTGLTYYRNQKSTVVETSWVDDKLVFSKEEFRNLARKMERWYGVSIVFDNERLMDIPFTGLFQKESIREALYALQLSEKFQYSMEGSVIHIY